MLSRVRAAAPRILRGLPRGASTRVRSVDPDVLEELHRDGPVFPVTSLPTLHGFVVTEDLGLLAASHVRTKRVVEDLAASIGAMFGSETTYYSHLLNETSAAAVDSLVTRAKAAGADAIVDLHLETTAVMNRMVLGLHSNVIAYGTAVKIRPER